MATKTELQGLLEKAERVTKEPSSDSLKELLEEIGKSLGFNDLQLAQALDVSAASIGRWKAGKLPPTKQLRGIQEWLGLQIEQLSESGVEFKRRKVGIYSIDAFFERAKTAKTIYVIKNAIGFQAGLSQEVKGKLRHLFGAANPQLKVCYGFPQGSEASMSFLNFKSDVVGEWPRNILWRETPPDDPLMRMLGNVMASPYFIEYADGRIDLFLEVPANVVKGLDDLDASFISLFIEIGESHKVRMWSEWKALLDVNKFDPTPVHIRFVKTYTEDVLKVRENAYGFESGKDDFDENSWFVNAQVEGKTIGSIRLTDSKSQSPLRRWSHDKSPLPYGEGIVEMTRGVVSEKFQHLGVYTWMMLRAMQVSRRLGFKKAVAAVETGYRLKGFLSRLGFEDVGKPLVYADDPSPERICQSIVSDLNKSYPLWDSVRIELEAGACRKHVNVVLDEDNLPLGSDPHLPEKRHSIGTV